jgi:hypothetical protein
VLFQGSFKTRVSVDNEVIKWLGCGGQWMAARQVSFQGPENQQQMPQPLTFMKPIPSYGCYVVYLSEDH